MKKLNLNKNNGLAKAAKLIVKRETLIVLDDIRLSHVNGASSVEPGCTSGEVICTRPH